MAHPGHAATAAAGHSEVSGIRRNLGVPLAVVLTAAVWFVAAPKGLSVEGQRALALFAGVFVLYLTEAIPLAVTSLMVVPAAVFMHVTNVRVALEGFSSASTYLIVGAFILATAMVKTGLAERITYLILLRTGCSPARITLGVMLANIVLAFLVPSATARTALLLPMCLSIISLFDSGGRSKFAVSLLLVLAFTNATIGAGILTATVPNPVTVEFLAKTGRIVTYTDWLLYGFPPALLMTFLTWWFVQRVYQEKREDLREGVDRIIRDKLAAMGKTTSPEWRALSVFLLVTFLWATQRVCRR
jgi:anion transporter